MPMYLGYHCNLLGTDQYILDQSPAWLLAPANHLAGLQLQETLRNADITDDLGSMFTCLAAVVAVRCSIVDPAY